MAGGEELVVPFVVARKMGTAATLQTLLKGAVARALQEPGVIIRLQHQSSEFFMTVRVTPDTGKLVVAGGGMHHAMLNLYADHARDCLESMRNQKA